MGKRKKRPSKTNKSKPNNINAKKEAVGQNKELESTDLRGLEPSKSISEIKTNRKRVPDKKIVSRALLIICIIGTNILNVLDMIMNLAEYGKVESFNIAFITVSIISIVIILFPINYDEESLAVTFLLGAAFMFILAMPAFVILEFVMESLWPGNDLLSIFVILPAMFGLYCWAIYTGCRWNIERFQRGYSFQEVIEKIRYR